MGKHRRRKRGGNRLKGPVLDTTGEFETSSCAGKSPLTFELAKKIARKKRRVFYKCTFCRRWHVGSADPMRKGKRGK